MTRPSELHIPVGYPNDDPSNGAGMGQRDYDEGQIGSDSLRTPVELLKMSTFYMLHPEAQRRHFGMFAACFVETGMLEGIGTGHRSYATQLANWKHNPTQFVHPDLSYHVERLPHNRAFAVDIVPGDTWPWMHANCARFGLIHLDRNEQHHTQLAEVPRGASTYSKNPSLYWSRVVLGLNIPYLGTASLEAWLAADQQMTATPPPTPTPTPTPTTCQVSVALAIGATGPDVVCLQRALVVHGQPGVTVDGQFGPQTDRAVRNYQLAAGLTVDGKASSATLSSLGIWAGAPAPPPSLPIQWIDIPSPAQAKADPVWLQAVLNQHQWGTVDKAQSGLNNAINLGMIAPRPQLAVDGQYGQLTAQAAADWVTLLRRSQ